MDATLGRIPSTANDTENEDHRPKSLHRRLSVWWNRKVRIKGQVRDRVALSTFMPGDRSSLSVLILEKLNWNVPLELLLIPACSESSLIHELGARHTIKRLWRRRRLAVHYDNSPLGVRHDCSGDGEVVTN